MKQRAANQTIRLLVLADLHRLEFDRLAELEQDRWLAGLLKTADPDVIVIVGDVFEDKSELNPYEELARLFGRLPVVCTLGNHEFYGHTVQQILKKYEDLYEPERWNVHYLDIVGSYDHEELHFFGNVLWYDGSLSTVTRQELTDFAGGTWRDYEIREFDPAAENRRCIDQIMASQPVDGQVGVLCTHCVPHRDLNGHMHKTSSLYNAFSGVDNLLDDVRCHYVLCAHTHWRIEDKQIGGKQCWNVGNNYVPPFHHILLEVESDATTSPGESRL